MNERDEAVQDLADVIKADQAVRVFRVQGAALQNTLLQANVTFTESHGEMLRAKAQFWRSVSTLVAVVSFAAFLATLVALVAFIFHFS